MELFGLSFFRRSWWKKRYLIVFLAFLGYINLYTMRVNLSVAIVAMTDKSIQNNNTTENTTDDRVFFDWDQKEKGIILGGFFYGYILTQLLGGYIATKFGGNIVFGGGLAVTSLACLATPIIARLGDAPGVIAIRVIQGMASGISLPSCHVLFSKWAPENERSSMMSLVFSGMYTGAVLSNLLSGVIAEKFGWESIFYLFGTVGIIWYIVWTLLVRQSPAEDSFISDEERDYITSNTVPHTKEKLNTPWKSLLTSFPVYAIAAALVSSNWGFYTMLTHLPSYLKYTLNFQLSSTGFISAGPYLMIGILMATSGYLADWLKVKGFLTVTQIRKLFLSGSFFLQGASLIAVGYISNPIACVILITISIGVGAIAISAFTVNPLDIAPQFAGIIIGMSNTLGTIPGIVSPVLTGFIVTNSTVSEWRIVFFIAATLYAFGVIFCGIFASGEIQDWAKQNNDPIKNKSEKVSNSTLKSSRNGIEKSV